LAAQFGVSRAPLREAIQILNTEGLLETVRYHGTKVRILTAAHIEELYSLRSILESFAVQRIIQCHNPEDIDILKQHYDDMLRAANEDDIANVNTSDRWFHNSLIENSRHKLLKTTWNGVAMRVRHVMALRNLRNEDIKQIAYNHLPFIEAIAAWDESKAVQLIQDHIASAGDLIAAEWLDNHVERKESDP
jgi:DNA-binding GntR family transcriptional regulator